MIDLIKIPLKEITWVESQVLKMNDDYPPDKQWRYKLLLPDFLACWDVFADWEVKHFLSMEEHLRKGDILFDIGTEAGWCNIIYAKFVGAENMVLVEPSEDFWPNIKAIWEKNYQKIKPLACYEGFFSNITTDTKVLFRHRWPRSANNLGGLVQGLSYKYIHEHGNEVPQIKLDDYVKYKKIIPNALTIDVEGAELLVLQGAEDTLKNNNLKVWVSIHSELGEKDYKVGTQQVHDFMAACGYKSEFLARPNEEHWYFSK